MEINLKLETGEIEQLSATAREIVAAVFASQNEQVRLVLCSAEKIGEQISGAITSVVTLERARLAEREATRTAARAAKVPNGKSARVN